MMEKGPPDTLPDVPPGPCVDCDSRVMCGVEKLACTQFLSFARGAKPDSYETLSKKPTGAIYERVFKGEAS